MTKLAQIFNEECRWLDGRIARCVIREFFPRFFIWALMSFKIFELSSPPHLWGKGL